MRTVLSLLTAASAIALANPASAAMVFCAKQNCGTVDENVLFNGTKNTVNSGLSINGHTNQTNTAVLFQADHNIQGSGGQAELTDSGVTLLTGEVSFSLPGYTFTSFEVNFPGIPGNPPRGVSEASKMLWTFYDGNGAAFTSILDENLLPYSTNEFAVSGNGNNWFSGYTTAGETISKVTWEFFQPNSAVDSMKQLRVGGIEEFVDSPGGVPEPSTWALMIAGFGLIGASLRRKHASVRYTIA